MAPSSDTFLKQRTPWPWEKLRSAVGKLPATGQESEHTLAVLVMTGALNPMHRGHVDMLRVAQARLQAHGYAVVASFVSPWDDKKVAAKAKRAGGPQFSSAFRLRQADCCTQDESLISVASWEACSSHRSPDYLEVVDELQAALKRECGSELARHEVNVFLVCGGDESKHCKRLKAEKYQGMVVVPCHGHETFLERPFQLVFATDPAPGNSGSLSSTKLLTAIRDGDIPFVEQAVPAAACQFLLNPSDAERQELASDFKQLNVSSADAGPWPGSRLMAEIQRAPADRMLAILVASGAMSPVHRGHLAMLYQAKARLEEAGYAVVGSWLSPSSARRTAREAKRRSSVELRVNFRMHLAELSACDDPFVSVGTWEASVEDHDPKPREIAGSLHHSIRHHFKSSLETRDLKTFFVCGSDCAREFRIENGFAGEQPLGVVVVPRDANEVFLEVKHRNVFLADPIPGAGGTLSSTEVRAALQRGDFPFVARSLAPAAARFLLSPTMIEYNDMRESFAQFGIQPPSALNLCSVKDSLKQSLKTYAGEAGVITGTDLVRILKALDPSWTDQEIEVLMCSTVNPSDGTVQPDSFVEWMCACQEAA